MNWLKLFVLSIASLVVIFISSLSVAQAHCTPLHLHHCNPLPQSTIAPVKRTYLFYVDNRSPGPVFVSYGHYVPATTSQRAGDYNLPSGHPSYWRAAGWWEIKPGETKWIYKTTTPNKKLYFRIERSGGATVTPNKYKNNPAKFCVTTTAYESKEYEKNDEFIVNGKRGRTCGTAGGYWATFYQMPVNLTFTVR